MKSKRPDWEQPQKDWRKSITIKNFFITMSVLLVSISVVYLSLYVFLPSFYSTYKQNYLEEKSKEIIRTIAAEDLTYKDGFPRLREFSKKHNISVILFYQDNPVQIASSNIPFTSIIEFIDQGEKLRQNLEDSRDYFYIYRSIIVFKDAAYNAHFSTPIQPVEEVRAVFFDFLPYIGAIILGTSLIVSLLYSRMITKPLVALNRVAKQMARMDFRVKSEISSSDELGELGSSLNILSASLEKAMEELKEANRALLSDIEMEKKRDEARIHFIATMSHELKSPITAIRGQLEGMLNNIGVYQNRDKYLERSLKIVQDLDGLVREILVSSKLDNQNISLDYERIPLAAKIEEILRSLDYLILERKIRVEKDFDRSLHIQGDWSYLKKAFGNILENSIRYAPSGSPVEIQILEERGYVIFQVHNQGEPIATEDLKNEKLFEAFYRPEKSRNRDTGGSGLGLSIVKKILNLHRFAYSMKNTPSGVLFRVEMEKDHKIPLEE